MLRRPFLLCAANLPKSKILACTNSVLSWTTANGSHGSDHFRLADLSGFTRTRHEPAVQMLAELKIGATLLRLSTSEFGPLGGEPVKPLNEEMSHGQAH